jgi:uncharacterized protein YhaN
MKLRELEIDGFGVWRSLHIQELSPNCTVFYGPNEAGKSTVLQFLRAMLYGFSPDRRRRYLPPVQGGTAGGRLNAAVDDGRQIQIFRRDDCKHPTGVVTITTDDGTTSGHAHLQQLLHKVDEATYENVFAVGLKEIQELGTLNEVDAARWLYSLSAGLDRVSLHDVLSELDHLRTRLIGDVETNSDGKTNSASPASTVAIESTPSQIGELLDRRDRLQHEIAEQSGQLRVYSDLVSQRATSQRDAERLQATISAAEFDQRNLEAALLVFDTWQRHRTLNSQIEAITPSGQWPEDAQARMEHIAAAIRRRRRQARQFVKQRQRVREEFQQIELNVPLWRQSAKIAALAEHEGWILSLEQELEQAEGAYKSLADQQLVRREQFKTAAGNDAQWSAFGLANPLTSRSWSVLREPAAALLRARRQAKAASQTVDQQRQTAQSRKREVETALASQGQRDLRAAVNTAGGRVAQLRNRLQLEQRLEQLTKVEADLETDIADLQARQILPPQMVVAVGAMFVLGIMFILSGLFLPASVTGSWGWPLALLGVMVTGGAVIGKYAVERSLESELASSQKQLDTVQSQIGQADAQRRELDQVLPKCAGPLAVRLQTAEQELARLEELLPLDAQRQTAEQTASDTDDRAGMAKKKYRRALHHWRASLAALGLPETLKPAEVRAMAQRGTQLGMVDGQVAESQTALDRRRRELFGLTGRIDQVFLAAGLHPPAAKPGEIIKTSARLSQLRRALAEEDERRQRRQTIRRQRKTLERNLAKSKLKIARLKRKRRHLLADCHVADEADFQRRAAESVKLASLIAERDALAREIASVLAGVASEPTIAALIADTRTEIVDQEVAAGKRRIDELKSQHRRALEQSGRCTEQIQQLAGQRRTAIKRFELEQTERQLQQAVRRWQVLAMTQRLLEQVKLRYERDRQPETLKEASGYLARLTSGRYRRVWTPLVHTSAQTENSLLVDDAEGRSLSPKVLSHGTREQLFLSLRLALVGLYSRRGIVLPMVLDDVLVNFDAQRAAAAVEVLCDYAAHGHQLIVFTCHEHIARLFKAQHADVRRLPENNRSGSDMPFEPDEIALQRPKQRKPKAEPVLEALAPIPEPPTPAFPLRLVSSTTAIAEVVTQPLVIEAVPPPPIEFYYIEPPYAPLVELPPAPSPQPIPIEPPHVEPPRVVRRPPKLRVDTPQSAVRLSPVFRRWNAEEFSGELDDQVNPLWLWREINGMAAAPALPKVVVEHFGNGVHFDPPLATIPTANHTTHAVNHTAVRQFYSRELLDEESPPIAGALPLDDQWEL